ncbi:hypothetical protein GCM10009785_21500 [Brooklawnia cerclae]|uniref:PPi-type phosphoenolpyruvate carboxykinase lobe 2 domain-containing protein n=1 Tax=Brooklawnia cerclae TaxID=349934 RepID=A0ABX0SIS5_9ACTN|nr:hypothetical protein [Brooklawnia cerclae]NIH58239.1 hypothetical protein [Brooklawnia cerclae]
MASDTLNAAINLRLALLELPRPAETESGIGLVEPLLARQRELSRRLSDRLSPADQRIQDFLDDYLEGAVARPQLPKQTLILDHAGLARGLSLPADGDEFHSALLSSYRLTNGVLHNPANDRRTTAGVFHVAEGGLPIPDDKIVVTRDVFAQLLELAFQPPREDMVLPYTAGQAEPAACFVSLLMRPLVVPEVPGGSVRKTMETRFIVPGGLVCNLDFVEGIFGNAGDPQLPENDAALDPTGWSGHTGCVILAPHLTKVTKKSLGMPHWDDATERQRRDGQCWKNEDDLYNGGQAFKVCARDERGVMVTVIADNYFGYCKKEVKTQLSYAANLLGCAEEEHSGGALVFPAYNLGNEFTDGYTPADYTLADVIAREPERFQLQPEGHALDLQQPHIVLVPGGATYSMRDQTVTWASDAGTSQVKLLAGKVYITPNGYRIFAKHREMDETQWHLVGVSPISTECHKPSTVSGGGKSEISKSISDAFVFGNAYAADFEDDMRQVQRLLDSDFSDRFSDPERVGKDRRPILSDKRSLGSVIKLLTPRSEYTDDYNHFLRSIPAHVKELLFTVKRYYKPEWGTDWRSHFSVGIMNGRPGNALRLDGDKVIANQLRVGFQPDGSWRLFSLRPDYSPAIKVQTEDDITASTVCPPFEQAPAGFGNQEGLPRKFVLNCEQLLFQRPDDAIHRGYDRQTEHDLAQSGTFISNFEPLTHADARELKSNAQVFSEYTEPMQQLISQVSGKDDEESPKYWIASDQPRLVNGKRSKNPRYLQVRPDVSNPEATAAAELASHLVRKLPTTQFAPLSVDIVAAGRRNNPKEEGVPPLCVYNPLHYMELPELFMEFISSMTGKSPSTTGAGSEGALTKGPFNAMPPIIDLNAAFLSYAITGYDGWLSSAGYIGPKVKVDHDISMLVPELFSRMWPDERRADVLIRDGYLDKLEDFEYEDRTILASRLGYRMNERFATTYFGRIFLHPDVVFTDEMLRPELQDAAIFAESMDVIVTTHQRVAEAYFRDNGIELAVPPLKGLLEIMANGQTAEGWKLDSPEFRELFTRESVLASDWYAARLDAKQAAEVEHQRQGLEHLQAFASEPGNESVIGRLNLADRAAKAHAELERLSSDAYRASLVGTIGRQVRFG